MQYTFKTLISLSKAVVFLALFAFFVSRVITAVTKLEHKESTIHIHSSVLDLISNKSVISLEFQAYRTELQKL